jgi:hypothetical protein
MLATPATVVLTPEPAVRWNAATRIAFRFCVLYFGLYVLTTQMLGGLWPWTRVPDMGATGWMKGAIVWSATHVSHVQRQYVTTLTGSGDKTIDWIHAFCLLVIAALGATVWSIVDRRRPNYVTLHKWFQVFLRFAVGTTMVGYGMVKAIPLQMPAPNLTRLLEPYGNFSPMGVLWYSVGASFPYERFAGSMELTAAVLLFIPRASMLGAMVLVVDSIQIFTLNMTYDIPVKLFSFHLILMGLYLLAPERRRLFGVLVLDRAAGPSTMPPLVRRPAVARVLLAVQLLWGCGAIAYNYAQARESWRTFGAGAPRPPLYGIWTVEKMTVDGVERAPLVTDYGRWRRVIFQNTTTMTFWRMDDTFTGYSAKVDVNAKAIDLTRQGDKAWRARFAFQQLSPDALVLDGEMDGHKVRMETRLFDRNRFLQISTGFHWIQERPFNR